MSMMQPLMLEAIIRDCEYYLNDLEALNDFLDNIEDVCEDKTGNPIDIVIEGGCQTTTPPPPTTTTATTTTATTPTTTTTAPCPCIDVVFMVDASNSMGATDFQIVIDYMKLILGELDIRDGCTEVGLMSFSSEVHVKVELGTNNDKDDLIDNKADALIFEAALTQTEKAIDELNAMLTARARGGDCQKVAVLLTDGMSTDWRATLDSMVQLYIDHPDIKVVVIAVEDPDMDDRPRPDQVRAIATGVAEDNLIEVGDFGSLTTTLAAQAAAMIQAANGPQGCTQWALVGTGDTSDGNSYVGVYETNTPLDPGRGACYGQDVYIHTSGDYWLGKFSSSGTEAWMVVVGLTSGQCVDPTPAAALLNFGATLPNETGLWTEIGVAEGTSTMRAVCYN